MFSAGLTACFAKALEPSWSWTNALLFGSLLGATDTVAVVALLRDTGGSLALRTLIEGESLFNDSMSIVLFNVFMVMASGKAVGGGEAIALLARLSLGGIALGWSQCVYYQAGFAYPPPPGDR